MIPIKNMALWLVILMGLTGCLTIEEHYVFRNNGSGNMRFVVDLGEIKHNLQGSLRNDAGRLIAEELQFDTIALQLGAIPGIKQIEVIRDLYQYRFGIAFKFRSITALNAALNVLIEGQGGHPEKEYITFNQGTVTRMPILPQKRIRVDPVEDPDAAARLEAMMGQVRYRLHVSTRRKVLGYESNLTKFDGERRQDPRSVWFQADLLSLTKDPGLLETTIFTR